MSNPIRMVPAIATLALAACVLAAPARAADSAALDFAGTKAKAAESGKLVLVDFSSPT